MWYWSSVLSSLLLLLLSETHICTGREERRVGGLKNKPYLHIHSHINHTYSYICLQFRRLALKSPPLGPKWGRWAKKLGYASDPPVCSLLVGEDRMRIQVFSPTYPTWVLVGGTSRPAGKTVFNIRIF